MVRFATLCSPVIVAALLLLGLAIGPSATLFAQDGQDAGGQEYRAELPVGVNVNFEDVEREFDQFRYDPIRQEIIWRGVMPESARDSLYEQSRDPAWRRAIDELFEQAEAFGETRAGADNIIEEQAFHQQPLNAVLRDYSELFGLNLVLSRGLTGEVTVQFRNVAVMDAFEAILRSQNLDYERIENEHGDDVLLIVPFEEVPPDPDIYLFDVPWPERHLVDIDFDELVEDIGEIVSEGRVISNRTSRIVLIEAPTDQIDLARRYLQLVLENLPERDVEEEEEEEEERRREEREREEEPEDREIPRRELFRLNPEPNFFDQAMEELTRLLGARPEVISDRHGVFVIEDTDGNLALAQQHIAFLNDLRPDEDRVDPLRLETRSYTLKQNAEEVAEGIEEFLSDATDQHPAGRLVVNRQLNSVMITDTVKNLEFLERYIRELDATPQQVLIESTILEATLDDSTEFGVQSFFQRDVGSGTIGYQNLGFDPARNPAGESAFRSFTTSAYNLGFIVGNEWEVALQAIQTTLDANILSRPKIVVANGREGQIEVGTVIPFIDVAGGAAGASQGVSFRDVLLRMQVTPHIEPGDRIRLELAIDFDARVGDAQLGGVGAGVPIISSRSVRTEVYINDGETLVIGGLYEERESNTVNKVPILGDVPVLGALFRQTSLERQKTDLLFLITPTIVRDLTIREITRDGRPLRVFRPEGPQIPDWYDDPNYTRLRGSVD